MRPLRITMIGTKGVPATFGGVERHVEELGARLVERGHKVTVHCRRSYSGSDAPASHRGMRLVTRGSVATKHFDALTHSALAAVEATVEGADVVHFHAIGPSIFSILPRLRRRSATVVSVHGLDYQRDKWGGVASRLLRVGEWTAGRFPDATICVSRSLEVHFRRRFAKRRIRYVPNGVPPATLRPARLIRDELGLDAGGYVLWVGRFVPEKAPELLLEAFAGVDTGKRLVLAGGAQFDDEYGARLERLAQSDPRVVLPGYVGGTLLEELYSNAALFVLPSRLEGLPIALLEAMSYGVPTLASDIDCHVEIIGSDEQYGRLCRAGDAADLRRGIEAALAAASEPDVRAARARRMVERNYAWPDVVSKVEDVYAEVVHA
jgi:glycosyltransferase involved in cell wall biosynthesis